MRYDDFLSSFVQNIDTQRDFFLRYLALPSFTRYDDFLSSFVQNVDAQREFSLRSLDVLFFVRHTDFPIRSGFFQRSMDVSPVVQNINFPNTHCVFFLQPLLARCEKILQLREGPPPICFTPSLLPLPKISDYFEQDDFSATHPELFLSDVDSSIVHLEYFLSDIDESTTHSEYFLSDFGAYTEPPDYSLSSINISTGHLAPSILLPTTYSRNVPPVEAVPMRTLVSDDTVFPSAAHVQYTVSYDDLSDSV